MERSCYQMLCAGDPDGTVVLLVDLGLAGSLTVELVVVGMARVVCTERQRCAEMDAEAVEGPSRMLICKR